MVGVGVGVVPMVMAVMVMLMGMVVMVASTDRNRDAVGLTNPCAFAFAEGASFCKPLDVVVVA